MEYINLLRQISLNGRILSPSVHPTIRVTDDTAEHLVNLGAAQYVTPRTPEIIEPATEDLSVSEVTTEPTPETKPKPRPRKKRVRRKKDQT